MALKAGLVDENAARATAKAVSARHSIARKYITRLRRRRPDATPAAAAGAKSGGQQAAKKTGRKAMKAAAEKAATLAMKTWTEDLSAAGKANRKTRYYNDSPARLN